MNEPQLVEVVEQQVIDYLKRYPDFFQTHPTLLSELALPHKSKGAISLIERQVEVLRERNIRVHRQLNDLIQTARANDDLFTKTRSLTLALLDVSSWHELNEVLATHLLVDFDADFVCCHLLREHLNLDHLRGHADTLPTAGLVHNSQPLCSTLRASELQSVFPVQDHEEDGSAVLLPLALKASEGCLAVGSRRPDHFASDMDTLFIGYIGDVLARIIDQLDTQDG